MLNFSDLGLGDACMKVIASILNKNPDYFSKVDLSKNIFKEDGLRSLADALEQTRSVFHVDLSCNAITPDGATYLF